MRKSRAICALPPLQCRRQNDMMGMNKKIQKRSLPHGKENENPAESTQNDYFQIGIDKENFDEENARLFLLKSYEELDAHKEARIIRNLCRIRTAMERNYSPSESCRSAHLKIHQNTGALTFSNKQLTFRNCCGKISKESSCAPDAE